MPLLNTDCPTLCSQFLSQDTICFSILFGFSIRNCKNLSQNPGTERSPDADRWRRISLLKNKALGKKKCVGFVAEPAVQLHQLTEQKETK